MAGDLSVYLDQAGEIPANKENEQARIYLLYWERYENAHQALAREKELNKLTKKKNVNKYS